MASFGTDFPGARLGQLGLSYRSTQKVLDALAASPQGMPLPPELANLPLKAERGVGEAEPELRTLDDPAR